MKNVSPNIIDQYDDILCTISCSKTFLLSILYAEGNLGLGLRLADYFGSEKNFPYCIVVALLRLCASELYEPNV